MKFKYFLLMLVMCLSLTGCKPLRDAQNSSKFNTAQSEMNKALFNSDVIAARKAADKMIAISPEWVTFASIATSATLFGHVNARHGKKKIAEDISKFSIDYLNDALKRFPNLPSKEMASLYSLLGESYVISDQTAQMADNYEKAIKLAPANTVYLNNYAFRLTEQRSNLSYAVDLARKAFKLTGDDPTVEDTLGWALAFSGKYKEAIEHLENALLMTSDAKGEIAYHLGYAYLMSARWQEAVVTLEKAINLPLDTKERAEAKRLLKLARQKKTN